jgi:peptide-methionine (S)-S-oxide reductase
MTDPASTATPEVAILGGGCFWCTEAIFLGLHGVQSVQPGYAGGQLKHPSYEQVCTKNTGHVEVVRIEFDSAGLAYRKLLQVFFATHDPTTPGRQGNDVGPQYASVIFWQTHAQREDANQLIQALDAAHYYPAPIVTQVLAPSRFWPAEDYHRNYFAAHPEQAYCQYVIAPKLAKFRQQFPQKKP